MPLKQKANQSKINLSQLLGPPPPVDLFIPLFFNFYLFLRFLGVSWGPALACVGARGTGAAGGGGSGATAQVGWRLLTLRI